MHLKCAIDISDESNLTVEEILDRIQQHLRQKRNVALDRVAFEERKQERGENFDDYYVAIRKLADESDLCIHCIEERLTTKIMSGLYNQETRQKLLAITPFPQLKTVVDICRSEESAAKDSMALCQRVKIEKITTSGKTSQGNQKERSPNCTRCGYRKHTQGQRCPAYNSECHNFQE